jgi:3-dehydroquinate synthase
MVDSSIGGKVGINHPRGKNLIGAFYQPRLVLSDVQTLETLPARELVSGWAEVVKHAMIRDAGLLEVLSERAGDLARLEKELTTEVVSRSAAIKAAVVSRDEKESGLRTILNYGHTIAHGLEAATSYERFLHGEAVAIGMMGAVMLSERLGIVNRTVVDAQRDILERLGLPVSFSDVSTDAILRAMALDKKVRDEKVRWVLLTGVGKPTIRDDVPPELVGEVLGVLTRS